MGSNLIVLWLSVLTTRQLAFLTSIHRRLIKIHPLGFGLQDQILSLNKSTEGELVAHSSPRTEIGENPSNPFRFKQLAYLVSQFTCHELADGHSVLCTRQAFMVRPPTNIARGPTVQAHLDHYFQYCHAIGHYNPDLGLHTPQFTRYKALQPQH